MIIVTGGAGFIGSNLIYALNKIKEKNIVICDKINSKLKKKYLKNAKYKILINPINLFNFLNKNSSDIKYIFHLGAISVTTATNYKKLLKNNYEFSCKIWKFCVKNQIGLIYASSASTYGDGSNGFKDSSSLEYLNKLKPLNLYGKSKHLFDLYIAKRIKNKELLPPQWVGLKFFNVYGVNEFHKKKQMSVISFLIPKIKKNMEIKLFKSHKKNIKDGYQKRDFIHVSDCLDIMIWLYNKPNISGIFNVGTGTPRAFIDLTKILFKNLKKKEKIKFIKTPKNVLKHYQYFTKADINKLRKSGYSKTIKKLEDGIQYHLKQQKKNNN